MAIDTQALKERINLVDLIGQDVILTIESRKDYEHKGACPWCGGIDRLRVKPRIWTCRRCMGTGSRDWQDAIAYVQRMYNLDFFGACEWLARLARIGTVPMVDGPPTRGRPKPAVRDPEAPAPSWQAEAWQVVQECERALWSNAGAKARDWLRKRGLKDDTLGAWKIGFNDAGSPDGGRKVHDLWVSHGITIPWTDGHNLWAVNVRRPVGDKYRMIAGSHKGGALVGVDKLTGKPDCLIVEGEFDAMLLWQEVGDLADVLTLGSASGSLADRWLPALIGFERFWIATDDDEAGRQAAEYWEELTGDRVQRVLPEGKDVTDAWQRGRDLRAWASTFLTSI